VAAVARLLASHRAGTEPLRVLSASGQLGFGIPEPALRAGIARKPHVIGADMGSIDPGPYYLGSGEMAAAPEIARRDLALVLEAARALDVPLVIGSAGTAGAAPQLDATVAMVRAIARERGLSFRLATIRSDIPADVVVEAARAGRLAPLGRMPMPKEAEIRASTHIVGQCGTETFRRALELDADVVIAGRACDTAIFAALPEMLGYPTGLALHMAKIVECTSLCCAPGGRDAMLAELTPDAFVLESMNPQRHATPTSVAAHALYEQADPSSVAEPTGIVRFDTARYEAVDAHRTRVSGAVWTPATRLSIKVEGALRVGERAVLVAGSADPTFIAKSADLFPEVERIARTVVGGAWTAHPRVYGAGAISPAAAMPGATEAAVIVEFIAPTADTAIAAASVYRQQLLHFGFPGRVSTAGNLAFPFTPPEVACGMAYRFSLYHAMTVGAIEPLFDVAVEGV
jgi:hypothetical protein